MKTKSFTKRLIICILAFASLVLAVFGFATAKKPINVDAVGANVSVPNGDFSSSSGSKMPYGVSNFSASQQMKDKDGNNINGIIDLSKEGDYYNFENAYANWGLANPKVLMINNKNYDSYFGYTTSSSFSLSANSFYLIKVSVFTNNSNGIANIYLYDEDGKVIGSLEHFSGKWNVATILVSTNELQSKSVTLGLFAKGQGVAMFDNITVTPVEKSVLDAQIANFETNNVRYDHVDLRDLLIEEDVLSANNAIFSKYGVGKNDNKNNTRNLYLNANQDNEIKNGNKPSALLIENMNACSVSFKTNKSYTFKQNLVYSVTISAKTVSVSGKASLKLVEDVAGLNGNNSEEISLSSNTNSFTDYTFYVRASSVKDTKYNILFSLGSNENTATGKVYISGIKISNINFSTYNSGSNKLDLASNETASSSIYFANGTFNELEVDDAKNPIPASATGWTVEKGKNKQVYGVVNTESTAFATMLENNNITLQNPGSKNGISNNNLLMLYNASKDSLTYTSSTVNIAKGDYKKFSLDLKTVHTAAVVSLVYKNDNVETIISSKTIEADTNWADGTTEFYVYSPYQNLDVSIRISINTEAWGACFVDEVSYFACTENQFPTDAQAVDLSNLLAANSNKDYAEAIFFTKSATKANVGIVNTEFTTIFDDAKQLSILKNVPNKSKNSSVLAVYAEESTYLTLTSKLGFSLASGDGEYYKLSLSIFTPNLTSEKENEEYGIGIGLTSFEENFKNLKATDGWKTYSFYISPDSATTTDLILSVGEEGSTCAGNVFFGNINFEKLENISSVEDFEALAKKDSNGMLLNKVTKTDDEENEEDSSNDNQNNVNWWYIVPSAIFAIAIIVCVVGVMARKVKWKKPSKKVKNAYDRNKTVSVQYYTRKATQERETKVRELQKELDNLTKQRSTYEEEYKHDMSTMRELKIKRASASEISKLEKDMKKNRKLASAIGLNIKRVENEIDYVKSPAYLNALIKKMSNEKQVADEQPENNAKTEDAAEKTETK